MYSSSLHARFAKIICNDTYRAQSDNVVPNFKEYIDKIYALCNSQFFKELIQLCCCWSVRTHLIT